MPGAEQGAPPSGEAPEPGDPQEDPPQDPPGDVPQDPPEATPPEGTPPDTPGDGPQPGPGDDQAPPPAEEEPGEQPPSDPGEEAPPEEGEPEEANEIQTPFTPGPFPREPEVGGFVIEVSELSGKRLSVRRLRADTSERRSEPQARLELRNVSLQGLNIYKNLMSPSGEPFHLRITTRGPADRVRITGEMRVDVSELYAGRMVGKLVGVVPITVKNYWTTEPETDLLTRLAGLLGLDIEAGPMKLNAHRLEVEHIVIPNLVLSIDQGHASSEVSSRVK
ncbi:MAG: hypothetical protein DIU69_11760 [Bacillota bacterium]|nr:MAG: hypothetical protein DIU69_11760 [Bacillota bacterium]